MDHLKMAKVWLKDVNEYNADTAARIATAHALIALVERLDGLISPLKDEHGALRTLDVTDWTRIGQ